MPIRAELLRIRNDRNRYARPGAGEWTFCRGGLDPVPINPENRDGFLGTQASRLRKHMESNRDNADHLPHKPLP
jgi:hypothetical protein